MSLWRFLTGRSDFVVEPPTRAELGVDRSERAGYRDLPAALRRPPRMTKRAYEMAKGDRLTSGWTTNLSSADGEIRYQQQPVMARARALEQNDPHVTKYLQLLESNVVGEKGIQPVPAPRDRRNRQRIDPVARREIRAAWEEWSKPGNCTVCGRYSLADVQRRMIRSTAVDGELFVQVITGPEAGNRFGFALQLLESELCDVGYSENLGDRGAIRMGVEVNPYRRPTGYHFFREPPHDIMSAPGRIGAVERRRVPADRVIHTALQSRMRPGQTRGISWLAPVGGPIYQLGQYRQAEIIAAREAASVNGWYKQPPGEDGFSGDFSDVDEYSYLEDVEAGEKRILPPGWEYEVAESQHPTTAFEPFSKSLIRSIASGFGLSYESVASDLSGASYSSGRIGALEDRQVFRTMQAWEIETLLDPIYPVWLEAAAIAGAFRLSAVDFDRLLPVRWATRGWSWVDPQKEGSGNQIGLNTKTRLVSDIVSDATGRTLEEHVEMLAEEVELFEEKGLTHPSAAPPPPASPSGAPSQDQDETEGDPEDEDE